VRSVREAERKRRAQMRGRVELDLANLRRFTKRFTKRTEGRADDRDTGRVLRAPRKELVVREASGGAHMGTGRIDRAGTVSEEHERRDAGTDRVEAADRNERNAERPREPFRDGHRASYAGEATRPHADDHGGELPRRERACVEQRTHERRELPLPLARCGPNGDDLARFGEGDRACAKRGIERDHAAFARPRKVRRRRFPAHGLDLDDLVAEKKTRLRTLSYTHPMHDEFGDEGRSISTRFHIVRCALEDIRERLDDLAPSARRDELAVEAISCAEAAARLEASIGSSVEAREALVRRIVDLEIAVLELGRAPVVGSFAPTEPPFAPAPDLVTGRPKVASTKRRRATDTTDAARRAS
jgi:hypothetical protein